MRSARIYKHSAFAALVFGNYENAFAQRNGNVHVRIKPNAQQRVAHKLLKTVIHIKVGYLCRKALRHNAYRHVRPYGALNGELNRR